MDIVGYGPTSSYSYIGSAMEAWCQTFIGGNSFDENERKLLAVYHGNECSGRQVLLLRSCGK